MRSRRRQRYFTLLLPTVTDDSFGQPVRTYSSSRNIVGFFTTGSGTKGELAEAIQGTQTNTLETRYRKGFEWSLEYQLKDIETKVVYRIVGHEDIDGRHSTIRLDLEEMVP